MRAMFRFVLDLTSLGDYNRLCNQPEFIISTYSFCLVYLELIIMHYLNAACQEPGDNLW